MTVTSAPMCAAACSQGIAPGQGCGVAVGSGVGVAVGGSDVAVGAAGVAVGAGPAGCVGTERWVLAGAGRSVAVALAAGLVAVGTPGVALAAAPGRASRLARVPLVCSRCQRCRHR